MMVSSPQFPWPRALAGSGPLARLAGVSLLTCAAASLAAQAQVPAQPPTEKLAVPSHAQRPSAQTLSYAEALAQLQQRSDRLAAARSAVDSAQLQREGMQGLGGPTVSLTGAAYTYNLNLNLNLDPLNQALPGMLAQLPPQLAGSFTSMPQLPSNYHLRRNDTTATASVSALWPIYMGGASDAARSLLDARRQEAEADAAGTDHEVSTLLVQRYFGAQLAERAARLREAALATIAQHDAAAQKMLDAGVVARVERLQARSALEEARRNASKARDDADLAATALARTLKSTTPVQASSALFVLNAPVQGLPYFIDNALARHPGLDKVAAKKEQASQLHAAQEALRRPQVFAFGNRTLKTGGDANWMAGVAVRFTLWDSIDRDALSASSERKVQQAERLAEQARSDIALLVEKRWLAVEQARRQYFAMAPSIELGQEVLRLRTAGLRAGTSTTLDLIDAQVNLAKTQTEQAQAAHNYVTALADLLESSGLSQEFGNYMALADVTKVE